MNILAIGASTSSTSINRVFARYAAQQIAGATVTDYDLASLSVPIYSSDEEKDHGIPAAIKDFVATIQAHDALVVSLAEHNGSYTAAFKNIYDWASRIDQKVWAGKPMLLLATSPGGRGGATVLQAASATFPRMGADLKASFSLPKYYDNFDTEKGITDPELNAAFHQALDSFI